MLPGDPMHATTMSAALTPHIHEFIDPADTASHYRRQTERLHALREKFDAQTALAELVVIRHQRAQNCSNPYH